MKIVPDILVGPNVADMKKPKGPDSLEFLESDLSQWLLKAHPDSETDMEKPKCPGSLKSLESDLSQWLLKAPPDSEIDNCDKDRRLSDPNGDNFDDDDDSIFIVGEEFYFLSAQNDPYVDKGWKVIKCDSQNPGLPNQYMVNRVKPLDQDTNAVIKVELGCDNMVPSKMVIKCDSLSPNLSNYQDMVDRVNNTAFSCAPSQLSMNRNQHQVTGGRNYFPVFSAFDWETDSLSLLKKRPPDPLSGDKYISWQLFKDFHYYDGVRNYDSAFVASYGYDSAFVTSYGDISRTCNVSSDRCWLLSSKNI
jgi:hypothetical protein